MYLRDKTIFLAGASGMAGRSILQRLLAQGTRLRVRAGYHRNWPQGLAHPQVEPVCADLCDLAQARAAARGCDCAVMAAATTAGSMATAQQPAAQLNDNLVMNARMLEAFHLEGIRRVVFVSSATVYQQSDGPLREDELDLNQPPHPASRGVGLAMRFCEQLCRFWHDAFGMQVVVARAANIFGPYAKFDPAAANFIPALIRKAVDRIDPFAVWGDPEVRRDVIYVDDFARAIVALLARDDLACDTFNVGAGTQTRVGDVVRWSLHYAGHHPSAVKYSGGPPTIRARALDTTRLQRCLGWTPLISPEGGVAQTTRWWQQNRHTWTR